MAISKLLTIGDCGGRFHGKHMKKAIEYICDLDKTENGKYIAGINCQPEFAYEQMRRTKEVFDKLDKRQAYHLIISFKENETDAVTAFEVVEQFVKVYLGKEYEAIYVVHDNTEHLHGHIIFNSVSYLTGKKFHYKKGDWAKEIQPIVNRLCEEYGLSTIEIEQDMEKKNRDSIEWEERNKDNSAWSPMIRRDLDACILQAPTYESFLESLQKKGYEIKNAAGEGKYLAIKPLGMSRFKRCKSLGADYTQERIRERILSENLSEYRKQERVPAPRIVTCHVRKYKKVKLSGLQKRYFAKLYRVGKLKKRAYSQAWKYKEEIKMMKRLQEEYFFLARHDVVSVEELLSIENNLIEKRKEAGREKSSIFRERAKYQPLFEMAEQMEELKDAVICYQSGDAFFIEEYEQYQLSQGRLEKEGYDLEELSVIKKHFKERIIQSREKEKTVNKELSLAKSIIKDVREEKANSYMERKENSMKEEKTIESKQPIYRL